MEAFANIEVVLAMWLLFKGAVWLRERFRDEEDTSVSLYCPRREERIPIASEETEVVWSEPENDCYGYRCEECGNIHTWVWGPPAPIYTGDKFRFTFNGTDY